MSVQDSRLKPIKNSGKDSKNKVKGDEAMLFTNKDGKHIYYEVINETSDKDTLVFLNGVMASTSSWQFQVNALKEEGYKMILHDFIGQLKSDKFEGLYSFEKHASDVKQLLDDLNGDHVHLIGTSYGGEVAMKFASIYPSMVKSMTVIDSVTEVDQNMKDVINQWIASASTYNGEQFFYDMCPTIYGKTFIEENKEALAKRAKTMNQIPKNYFDGQIALYKTFLKDVSMTNDLKKITCPSLIVCGEEDTLKPVKYSKLIVESIQNATLKTIPDCGHVTIFEKPDVLNKFIKDFLKNS